MCLEDDASQWKKNLNCEPFAISTPPPHDHYQRSHRSLCNRCLSPCKIFSRSVYELLFHRLTWHFRDRLWQNLENLFICLFIYLREYVRTKKQHYWITSNMFCGTWNLSHSQVRCKIWRHHRAPRPQFSVRRRHFGDSAVNNAYIAYFSLRMRKTVIIPFPVWNLTWPTSSSTLLPYNTQEFWRLGCK